jgi:helix-turn-helix protein
MDSLVVARSLRASIGLLAMEWLIHPTTFEKGAARGMPTSMAAYAVGRFGALGDVPPDNVVGAAFFWHPDLVHELWAEGRAVIEPGAGAGVWADICAEWGETRLSDFDGATRLGEILELVVDTASPLGAPLFVGWRDLVTAPPGPGRTFQLAQAMRELRFSRHCVAVQAAGVSPLDAILSGAAPGAAKMFGWPEPYPDVSHLSGLREEIEAQTDRLHASDLEVLSAMERAELRELAKAARSHATDS